MSENVEHIPYKWLQSRGTGPGRDPWVALMLAWEEERGLRLSPAEVRALGGDGAIRHNVVALYEDEEPTDD